MSTETRAALEDAIRAHIGQIDGAYPVEWALTVAAAPVDADYPAQTLYYVETSDSRYHSLLGLLKDAPRMLRMVRGVRLGDDE